MLIKIVNKNFLKVKMTTNISVMIKIYVFKSFKRQNIHMKHFMWHLNLINLVYI